MQTAIIAGGKGTRIAEYYPNIPKPMIPLNGKPLLQHQIEMLVNQGLTQITLIVGYKSEVIENYFGNGFKYGAEINYIKEDTPLDTGGALSLLPKEDTLILLGDVYCNIDVDRLIAYHRNKQADITLFVHPNNHPQDSDIVVADDEGKVTEWNAKSSADHNALRNLVNAGIYLINADMLPNGKAIKRNLNRELIIPQIGVKKVYAYRSTEYVKDMGTIERLRQVENDISEGIAAARSLKNKQKAIFLDRDGTINIFDGLITNPNQLKLADGAAEAIRYINKSEYLAICVTNQPVIARGDVTFEQLNAIHARLDNLLGEQGAYLDNLLFCPHHPDKGFEGERIEYKTDCNCRKPKPGLLIKAAEIYNIDLSKSYIIGDTWRDVEAGKAAGCQSIQLDDTISIFDAVKKILKK